MGYVSFEQLIQAISDNDRSQVFRNCVNLGLGFIGAAVGRELN